MNKKLAIGGILIVIVAIAVGYFGGRYVHSSKDSIDSNETSTTTANVTEEIKNKDDITFTPITPVIVSNASLFSNNSASSHIYNVGTVTSENYAGADVWLVTTPCDGPCNDVTYHFLNNKGSIVYIKANSNELYSGDSLNRSKFTIDSTSTITSLIFPAEISHDNASFSLDKNTNIFSVFFDTKYKISDLKLVFTDPNLGPVYTDIPESNTSTVYKENGFYMRAPDGTLRTYALNIGFYDKNHSLPAITWNDGTANTTEYVNTDRGGCGARNYASVVTDITMNDLNLAGKTSTGDNVYTLKDSENALLKKIYANDYNPYNATKLSYANFIAARPAFFWFDQFGRLIKFQRADFIPQAECGKPVIYLYPMTTTDISVKIDPQGGLTKSEPEYNSGWNVIANPNGELKEVHSGISYPYLFWEGRGGIYHTPEKGFVTRAADIHNFLIEKLTKLGLNKKEQADFIEFWEPRMTGAPYFFVTFLGNKDMDAIAPLTISPKPDSVIRILMDFTPLQKLITVQGYEIKTPERNGFTVVEWGGVLR